MTDLEKAARMALEALVDARVRPAHKQDSGKYEAAITAIREALAEQPTKQRHIAYVCPQCHWTLEEQPAQQEHKPWCASLSNLFFDARPCDCKRVPLPPPQRKPWVGLTPEEVKEISLANRPYVVDMVVALEQRLKEKNT